MVFIFWVFVACVQIMTSSADMQAQLQAMLATLTRNNDLLAPSLPSPSPPAAAAAAASSSSSSVGPASAAVTPSSKQQKVLGFIEKNRNAGTSRAYASGWAGFVRYLEREKIAEADITEWEVADYLRERVEEHGVAASTLSSDRSAIADKLKHTKHKDITNGLAVTSIMAVLRTIAAPSKPKQHMTKELMRELVVAHDRGGPSGRANAWLDERNIFLMLLMMMAFLRESEAVALTPSDLEVKTMRLKGVDVQVLHVFIARSKTDQAKVGHLVLLSADERDTAFCPVRRYALYAAAVKKAGVATEFLFPTDKGAAMSSNTPCGLVQAAVRRANKASEEAGLGETRWGPPESYGSHSLRRGGVTTARTKGVSMLDIQKHGRWKSLVVFSYVGTTPEEQLAVTNSFFQSDEVTDVEPPKVVADVVPSLHARALRAAEKKEKKVKQRGTKRARSPVSDSEGNEEDEEDTAEQKAEEEAEELLFEAQCAQGYREEPEKRYTPRRGAKTAAAAAKSKETQLKLKAKKKSE